MEDLVKKLWYKFSVKWHQLNKDLITVAKLKSHIFYEAGWNAALDWAAENARMQIVHQKDYEDANENNLLYVNAGEAERNGPDPDILIDKQSILKGKIK